MRRRGDNHLSRHRSAQLTQSGPIFVVNRKQWGGNRTWHGADTQQVLMSVIRTARQQDTDPVALLADLLHQPTPGPSPALRIPTPAPQQLPATGDQPKPARGP